MLAQLLRSSALAVFLDSQDSGDDSTRMGLTTDLFRQLCHIEISDQQRTMANLSMCIESKRPKESPPELCQDDWQR